MNRRNLLIVLAILIIVIGVGAAVLLPGLTGTGGGAPTATPQGAIVVTGTPGREIVIQPTNTPEPTIDIVVAVQPIGRGQSITPDLVDFRTWPEIYAPQNAITALDEVVGKIARVDIFPESPVTRFIITEDLSNLGAVGSDAGALLPLGTRMISMPIDRLTSAAYSLQSGDRVDIIASLLYVDVDEEFQTILPNLTYLVGFSAENNELTILEPLPGSGRVQTIPLGPLGALPAFVAPSEATRPRLTTQMTIQDALVVLLGDFPPDGRIFGIGATPQPVPETVNDDAAPAGQPTLAPATNRRDDAVPTQEPQRPDIVSLAVSPQEAVVLAYFIESKTPLTLALRPANEVGTQNIAQVDLEYIMSQYRIALPRRLPYAIEPAIRSIRQLIAGETIELRPEVTPAPAAQTNQGGGGN